MSYVIDPLFRANIATLIIDNTGLKNVDRSRGSSSKGDLNEVLFSMETVSKFDLYTRGKLKLKIDNSRFGNRGEWTMDLGGGYFYPWKQLNTGKSDRGDFREAVEKALADGEPRGQDKLVDAVRTSSKVKISNPHARQLLNGYAKDPKIPISHSEKGYQIVPA